MNDLEITITNTGGETVMHIPLVLKKRHGRKQIILPNGSNTSCKNINTDLLALAIAKGFIWQELIDKGRYSTMRELAKDLRLDLAYVARTIRLTLLAPDIIEEIMAGNCPQELTLERLSKKVPVLWEEQRREWGMG
jgi:hypothetical protein